MKMFTQSVLAKIVSACLLAWPCYRIRRASCGGCRTAAAGPVQPGRARGHARRRGRNRFRRRAADRLLGRDRAFSRPGRCGTADRPGPRDPGPAAAARGEPDGTPLLRFERSHDPSRRCPARSCGQQAGSGGRRPSGSSAASAKPWSSIFPSTPRRPRPGRSNSTLTDAQARLLADPVRPIHVAGGCAPWTGSQRFDLTVDGTARSRPSVTIEANVRIIAPVVVALHSLARGAVIREGDVELQHLAAAEKIAGALHAVEEAIGHELVRPVPAGSCGLVRLPASAAGRPSRRGRHRLRPERGDSHPHQCPLPRRRQRGRTGGRRVALESQHVLRPRQRDSRSRGLCPAAAS